MNIWTIIVTFAICFIPVTVIFAILPYIGRRTLTFGVAIPRNVHDDQELKEMRKSFSIKVIIVGLLSGIISAVLFSVLDADLATGLMAGLLFAYIIIIYILYVINFRRVKEIKKNKGWKEHVQEVTVADTQFHKSKRSVSALWFLVYCVIIVATILIGVLLYENIPEKVPMQSDINGNITRYAEKNEQIILFAPALQAVMALVFGFIYWIMQKTPPVIDPDAPEITSQQNTKFRYRWSAFIVFGGIVLLLVFMSLQLSITNIISLETAGIIPLVGAGVLVAGAIILSIASGQSGSRIRVGKQEDGKVIHRDDDKYWKWGSFYVNKDDPALFVEKRFGVGFTINFGRPAAVLIFVGVLAVILIAAILSSTLAG